MPLIILCGYPSSGKTTFANKLAEYFRTEKGKEVVLVREEDHFRGEKNDILDDSRKEKELRARLKSDAQRSLTKTNVVILDGLNYIKGYRYELYCMSKSIPTRQVTVQCDISNEMAWEWNLARDQNVQYKREVFDHLIQRFEAPDSRNRWDSPFFNVLPGLDNINFEDISRSLFFNAPPKPNESTKNVPLSMPNALSNFEKVTSEIIQTILANLSGKVDQEAEEEFDQNEIKVPNSSTPIVLGDEDSRPNIAQLNKLKRQFISLTRNSQNKQMGETKEEIGDLFVQYLNSQLAAKE